MTYGRIEQKSDVIRYTYGQPVGRGAGHLLNLHPQLVEGKVP